MLVDSKRLEEAGGKAERDAIAVPHLASLAGGEAQPVGIGELLAVEVGKQQLLGRVVVDMLARIDEAVAGAMLERDAPLPAGLARGRARVRRERRWSARTAPPSPGRTAASGVQSS